eukprot:6202771-Pleurochrysis_carterae.AAC.1
MASTTCRKRSGSSSTHQGCVRKHVLALRSGHSALKLEAGPAVGAAIHYMSRNSHQQKPPCHSCMNTAGGDRLNAETS